MRGSFQTWPRWSAAPSQRTDPSRTRASRTRALRISPGLGAIPSLAVGGSRTASATRPQGYEVAVLGDLLAGAALPALNDGRDAQTAPVEGVPVQVVQRVQHGEEEPRSAPVNVVPRAGAHAVLNTCSLRGCYTSCAATRGARADQPGIAAPAKDCSAAAPYFT